MNRTVDMDTILNMQNIGEYISGVTSLENLDIVKALFLIVYILTAKSIYILTS